MEFSEPVIVNASNFFLTEAEPSVSVEAEPSVSVEAEVSVDRNKAILIPVNLLPHGVEYIVHLTNEISDLAGNTLERSYEWNFITVECEPHGLDWSRTFGGPRWDCARSVQQTTDGGYILAGYTDPTSSGIYDALLIKTDVRGVEQWSQTFGGAYQDWIYSVQQTTDGGYVLAGRTMSSGAGQKAWLIKTDAAGVKKWDWHRTSGSHACWNGAESVQQTTDGNYILAGYTRFHGAGGSDAWLVKIDTVGAEYWNRTFGGSGEDGAYSVQQTTDGGYILAGYTNSYGAGREDAWLIKTDAAGVEQWSQTFGGVENEYVYSVQQTTDGGYILAGWTCSWSYETGWNDAWLIKVSH